MRRTAPLLAMLLVAGTIGCGESRTEEPARASLSKAEFLAQANKTCKRTRDGVDERIERFFRIHNLHKSVPVLNAELAHSVLLPTIEAEIDRVYLLDDYVRYQESLDPGLAYERLAIDDIANRSRLSSLQVFVRRFDEAVKMLRESGLPGCASSPQEIVALTASRS
jgi:hypothetical protein